MLAEGLRLAARGAAVGEPLRAAAVAAGARVLDQHAPVADPQPDAFDEDAFLDQLATRELGGAVLVAARVASTQTLLSEGFGGVQQGLLCVAERQTGGRGRGDNQWEAPPGSLAFSFKLSLPAAERALLPVLQYGVALAVVRAARGRGGEGAPVRIKWPNDVYDESGRKLGGVLCQSSWQGGAFDVVVGVGVNLDNAEPTVALNALRADAGAPPLSREAFLADFCAAYEAVHDAMVAAGGFAPVEDEYLAAWLHSGQRLTLQDEGGAEVTVTGLAAAGGLRAVADSGQEYELFPDGNRLDFFKGLVSRRVG